MNMYRYIKFLFLFTGLLLSFSCQFDQKKEDNKDETLSIEEIVDIQQGKIEKAIGAFKVVAILDHHRMAKDEGVYTPPSIASIFSDSKIISEILSKNGQLVGLDLPFKILCYSEVDTSQVHIAYTSANFIAKRHEISLKGLSAYSALIKETIESLGNTNISEANLDSVSKNYGIVKIQSEYEFGQTVENLKQIVNAQTDTKWFGEIDYKAEAEELGTILRPTTLLLFGGPAPGGKAMMSTPKIGLDAFCQKLLVYENESNEVWIAFNDIVAFSELYYGKATKPQRIINQRLTATFSDAIQK